MEGIFNRLNIYLKRTTSSFIISSCIKLKHEAEVTLLITATLAIQMYSLTLNFN